MANKEIVEFGDKQLKGINLTIKGVAKKYPFITGWELNDNWDKWFSLVIINLIVDLEMKILLAYCLYFAPQALQ
jgi:hypothetical protein